LVLIALLRAEEEPLMAEAREVEAAVPATPLAHEGRPDADERRARREVHGDEGHRDLALHAVERGRDHAVPLEARLDALLVLGRLDERRVDAPADHPQDGDREHGLDERDAARALHCVTVPSLRASPSTS